MQFLEELFNQMIEVKSLKVSPMFKQNFYTMSLYELFDNYLILTPTQRNIEIANAINGLYPESVEHIDLSMIVPKYKPKLLTMFSDEMRRRKPNYQNIVDSIKRSGIVIKKTPEVLNYLDSLSIIAKLTNKRHIGLAQINSLLKHHYFNGFDDYLSNYSEIPGVKHKISIHNKVVTHEFEIRFEINAHEFLGKRTMEHKKKFRDDIVKKSLIYVSEIFPDATQMRKTGYSIRLERNIFDNLTYSTRSTLSTINVSSSGALGNSKFKNNSYFVIAVDCKTSISDAKKYVFNQIDKSESYFDLFYRRVINKARG